MKIKHLSKISRVCLAKCCMYKLRNKIYFYWFFFRFKLNHVYSNPNITLRSFFFFSFYVRVNQYNQPYLNTNLITFAVPYMLNVNFQRSSVFNITRVAVLPPTARPPSSSGSLDQFLLIESN